MTSNRKKLNTSKPKTKITISEEEKEAVKKVLDYKLIDESNVVSILWKEPDLYFTYDSLNIKNFNHDEWKTFYEIGYQIIVKEGMKKLDEITVNLFLEKHKKLKEKYIEYGEFQSIKKAATYVQKENIQGYINSLNKWKTVINLAKMNFPISHRLKDFVSMSAEEIYDEYEAVLNHIFSNVEDDDNTYDISDGIDELIDELDEGLAVGLPVYNSPILNSEIGGNLVGNMTLVGGLSGMGKTALSRSLVIPSIIEHGEKIVIMINEEGLKKWQREMLVWIANNIYQNDLQKYKLRNGNYSKELKTFLKEKCAKWLKDHKRQIIIKPFKKYSTNQAIKCIKKYSHMKVKYFMLDTYKADADSSNNETMWLNLQQNMVKIYDTIKPDCKNVHIWITFQLSKSSSRQRFYSQDNIGMAKNIIDVASTCIMVRSLLEDELPGGKHALEVFKKKGKNDTKIPITLDPKKHYQILFIIKNREGSSNAYQVVVEHDLSRNIYNEIGITSVPCDF